jgi:hypothetical protein
MSWLGNSNLGGRANQEGAPHNCQTVGVDLRGMAFVSDRWRLCLAQL